MYLHDSYISKFELMNYLFANLLVAWLYKVSVASSADPNQSDQGPHCLSVWCDFSSYTVDATDDLCRQQKG